MINYVKKSTPIIQFCPATYPPMGYKHSGTCTTLKSLLVIHVGANGNCSLGFIMGRFMGWGQGDCGHCIFLDALRFLFIFRKFSVK